MRNSVCTYAVCAGMVVFLAGCPNSSTGGGTPATPPTITFATGVTCPPPSTVGITVPTAKLSGNVLKITVCITCNGAPLNGVPTITGKFTAATADDLRLDDNHAFRTGVAFPATGSGTNNPGCTTKVVNISSALPASVTPSDIIGKTFNVQVVDTAGTVQGTGSATIN